MKQIKPGTDLAGKPYAAKDLEGFTEQGSGAYLEDRDPRQMLHDMKTEARANQTMTPADESKAMDYFGQGPPPTRGAETTETPRIGAPGTGPDVKLASGVYEGAGGYEYEVMPGGEIKILKAPKGRGVGVTLKLGHPAHEAIFDELSEGGSSPMDGFSSQYLPGSVVHSHVRVTQPCSSLKTTHIRSSKLLAL